MASKKKLSSIVWRKKRTNSIETVLGSHDSNCVLTDYNMSKVKFCITVIYIYINTCILFVVSSFTLNFIKTKLNLCDTLWFPMTSIKYYDNSFLS